MSTLYTAELYGDSFADVYDDWYGQVSDADAAADVVHRLCGSGTVLELGVGSGRLAYPLIERGVTVVGLDASAAMLALCKPSDALTLVLGDMRNLPFATSATPFTGVLIGFNTVFNLVTEAQQKQLFKDAASTLTSDGYLIVEAANHSMFDPELVSDSTAHTFGVTRQDDDTVVVASTDVNYSDQTIDGCHIELSNGGIVLRPWKLRWSSVDQLDAYALEANFLLHTRTADWAGSPFTQDSPNHVSVYRLP